MIDVSIVIVSYNTKKLLKGCLESIKKHTKEVNCEVVVVDNASRDGSAEEAEKSIKSITSTTGIKNTLIKNKENLGFAKANNQGIKKAKGRYVLLLNSDTKLIEDSLTKMVMWMDPREKVGIATCALTNPDGSLQATGGSFPNLPRVFAWATFLDDLPFIGDVVGSYHPHTPNFYTRSLYYTRERQLDWVTGAFFLMRGKVIDEIGLLDEDFFMYVEELEYCLRAKKAGWQVWYTPVTRVVHYGRASSLTSEIAVLGEFSGLELLYDKHYPRQKGFLQILLKLAAAARILVFGKVLGRKEARKIYAKALANV